MASGSILLALGDNRIGTVLTNGSGAKGVQSTGQRGIKTAKLGIVSIWCKVRRTPRLRLTMSSLRVLIVQASCPRT